MTHTETFFLGLVVTVLLVVACAAALVVRLMLGTMFLPIMITMMIVILIYTIGILAQAVL